MISKQLILHSVGAFGVTILMAWLQIRTFGILGILALLFWIYKTRCPSMKIIVPENVTLKCQSIYNSFAKLRYEKPGTFCTITSLILLIFAIFGHIVSGEYIVLFSLMLAGLISTRHNFTIVRDDTIDNKNTNRWGAAVDNDNEVDEFLPVVNENALFVLNRAGEEAVISSTNQRNGHDDDDDNSSEPEVPADLILPDEQLPEVDEHSISSDEEDILIDGGVLPLSADGDDGNKNSIKIDEIKFSSKHFNGGDSSSSDDDSITKGLSFHNPNVTYVDSGVSIGASSSSSSVPKSAATQIVVAKSKSVHSGGGGGGGGQGGTVVEEGGMLPNLSNLVQWGVNNIIKSAVQQQIQQQLMGSFTNSDNNSKNNNLVEEDTDPSDEEYDEYEIINPEDLNS